MSDEKKQETDEKKQETTLYYLLVGGAMNPPKSSNGAPKFSSKDGGPYLLGVTQDLKNMENLIQSRVPTKEFVDSYVGGTIQDYGNKKWNKKTIIGKMSEYLINARKNG
eukprot:UN02345